MVTQLEQKESKIRALEKSEKRQMIDKDRLNSLEQQICKLQEKAKNL